MLVTMNYAREIRYQRYTVSLDNKYDVPREGVIYIESSKQHENLSLI